MIKTRGEVVARRTYCRLKEDGSFETWDDVCDRVATHQKWLWERALTQKAMPGKTLHSIKEGSRGWVRLSPTKQKEIDDLCLLFKSKKGLPSGRTLWLGGTDVAKRREASMFNCSFCCVETVYDVVDVMHLLLQGCGTGAKPVVGTLNGFRHIITDIEVIRSARKKEGGRASNRESFEDGVWTIQVGDSAEAWAKSIGKILAGKYKADKLVFDFSQIRPKGYRLKGYGWISSGDDSICIAFPAIAAIMNRRAGALLDKIDIMDILNWMGTILSSRRSAEIILVDYGSESSREFADAKNGWYELDDDGNMRNPQRVQSNNSLLFHNKPSRDELVLLFKNMEANGGSEPGFINAEAAGARAPWFVGVNPCAEILLPNKGFCNLIELNVSAFVGQSAGMFDAMRLLARANYRQTIVDLRDGILQESWHLNNEFLRLCGAGATGIVSRDDMTAYQWKELSRCAIMEAHGMAKELGTQRPSNVTTCKPSGTISKVMGCSEGIHKPLGKYIFNWIKFSKNDSLVPRLKAAGYRAQEAPTDVNDILICFPVQYDGIKFESVTAEDGRVVEINTESAVTQLERYKKIQTAYCDQNVSNTISYDSEEVPGIIDWLLTNWDIYVGVSFLYRADPSKTAADLGYTYLPQEVVTKEAYTAYTAVLSPVVFSGTGSFDEIDTMECATGACPIK